MNIIGNKILLRAIEEKDNKMLLQLINDPDTEMMIGGSSWPVSEEEQLIWFERGEREKNVLRCIVAQKENEEPLGTVILTDIDQKNGVAQIHIKMSSVMGRGKGYGTEAVKMLVQYAFEELRLNCIYADILEYNEISQHLFEKCGFLREGVLKARVYKRGKYFDVYSYSIVKSK